MKLCLLLIATAFVARVPAQTQRTTMADSVFDAELIKLLVQQSQRTDLRAFPSLTISAQYSRHRPFDDQPVYQRGPYDLTEQIFRSNYRYRLTLNAEPRPEEKMSIEGDRLRHATALLAPTVPMRAITVAPAPASWYVCGMLVRGPQVGETPDARAVGGEYLVRIAAIPVKYANDTLWLLTLLQRARTNMADGRTLPQDNASVYKKLINLRGSESLTLQIPAQDPSDETVEEITLTHETPQGFGLAQNIPDPMDARTVFAYALPAQSTVQISILKPDGSSVDTLVHGVAEAGVYRCVWDAGSAPPGPYLCSIEATPTSGGSPYLKQVSFSRSPSSALHTTVPLSADSVTEQFPVATIPLEQQRSERIFRLMVEGGASYLDPRKTSSPFDNMFSHVAIGLGFALTKTIEVGVIFGQDGFHAQRDQVNPIIIPSTDEAIETRIVPWAGGYSRIYFSSSSTRGFFHASIASATGGVVSTFGIGLSMTLSGGLSLYLLPHRTDQWNVQPSTKWGMDYGIAFLF